MINYNLREELRNQNNDFALEEPFKAQADQQHSYYSALREEKKVRHSLAQLNQKASGTQTNFLRRSDGNKPGTSPINNNNGQQYRIRYNSSALDSAQHTAHTGGFISQDQRDSLHQSRLQNSSPNNNGLPVNTKTNNNSFQQKLARGGRSGPQGNKGHGLLFDQRMDLQSPSGTVGLGPFVPAGERSNTAGQTTEVNIAQTIRRIGVNTADNKNNQLTDSNGFSASPTPGLQNNKRGGDMGKTAGGSGGQQALVQDAYSAHMQNTQKMKRSMHGQSFVNQHKNNNFCMSRGASTNGGATTAPSNIDPRLRHKHQKQKNTQTFYGTLQANVMNQAAYDSLVFSDQQAVANAAAGRQLNNSSPYTLTTGNLHQQQTQHLQQPLHQMNQTGMKKSIGTNHNQNLLSGDLSNVGADEQMLTGSTVSRMQQGGGGFVVSGDLQICSS